MIHFDTHLLIALIRPDHLHHSLATSVLSFTGPYGGSSIAWMELRSKPVHDHDVLALQALLTGDVNAFDQSTANLAGELYHLTGSKRRTRLGSMIAATAILAGAELATVNPEDFQPFEPHGLKLLALP